LARRKRLTAKNHTLKRPRVSLVIASLDHLVQQWKRPGARSHDHRHDERHRHKREC
jgi:hypothetical protein